MRKVGIVCSILLITAVIAACFDAFPTKAKAQPQSSFTAEQQEWINALTPQKVARYMRRENWHLIKTVEVVDMTRTSTVEHMEPTDRIPNLETSQVGQNIRIWMSLATPKNFKGPQDVQMLWYVNGEQKYMKTLDIKSASPHYRLWDQQRIRWSGNWEVLVKYQGEEIHRLSFVAK